MGVLLLSSPLMNLLRIPNFRVRFFVELNGDRQRKVEPLEKEAGRIKRRLQEIEQEIGRYVKAPGQRKLSIGRLETEISALEKGKQALQKELDDLDRKTNESASRDFNAELLQRTLKDFKAAFTALTPREQSEALQCGLKGSDRPSRKTSNGGVRAGGIPPKFAETSGLAPRTVRFANL